ncbi:hypothetical protein BCR32DRAFT_305342 [Anaeromyces robustus]|uniref:Uncharacterized protein n=1 Tax=Anaeromyces robustus TaxID=1754192 RepID=A0A1Y1WDY9_9FUNG|nr:hypothetical protein BCR32DRAFT_305342 [Anaeromyces robustus]|eukprot:ORX71749.1 hypothetical protein BCR32DRAFT_305342 [Anaeromyces robustus]
MKLIILLLILTISISTYANTVNFLKLLKRDVSYDEEEFLNSLGEECRTDYENSDYYNKCIPEITLENYKTSCSDVVSEKCQKFYDDPLKFFPKCKDISVFKEFHHPVIMKTIQQTNDVYCQTNEEGKLCPYSLSLMTESNGLKALEDQCKSKKCTESLLKIFKDIDIDQYTVYESASYTTGSYTYNDINIVNEYISILESNTCKAEHVTSDAINMKSNNILLTLLLLLLLLYIY